MTVTASLQIISNIREALAAADLPTANSAGSRTVTHDLWNYSLPADTVIDYIVAYQVALAGASETIDLTAAPQAAGQSAVDLTGKKVIAVLLYADSANAADITIGPGAADPYNLFGASNELDLHKGDYLALVAPGLGNAAVAAAVKDIKVAGTVGDKLAIGLLLT